LSVDPNLIRSTEAAVQKAPGDPALRLHLSGMLLEAGRPQAALDQCLAVLTRAPNHPEALGLASRAAEAAGDTELASRFKDRLLRVIEAPLDIRSDAELLEMMENFDDELGPDPVPAGFVGTPELGQLEAPRITLADVGGMEEVKRRLNSAFLAPLQNPELRKLYGKSLRGGLLLYGPPGCGKTFIARAIAGELGASFFSVGLNDVLDMWLGNSERNLHQIFETARKAAPCVLFLDEVDALGQKRSHLRYSAGRGVVNQLLLEMDGAKHGNEGLFILAASNHPWDIDTALRRPGRLDRSVLVLPPDLQARKSILAYHFKERPSHGLDFEKIAGMTDAFSGADLAFLVESATEFAFEDSVATGRVRPVTMGDVSKARRDLRPSTTEWLEVAKNYAMFSNESGTYDDLIVYLRQRKLL